MRVLLGVEMEGISQITSYRELWAPFPEYWDNGREATTADVVAAIKGLRHGGATSITVCEMHAPALGEILDRDALPSPACWSPRQDALRHPEVRRQHDAVFLLGYQARCGTAGGFMSHTGGINLRVAIDGRPVTEAHIAAWQTELPLLGVTGDAALEPQLDFALEGVPFLSVKQAINRAEATPNFSPDESAAAIEAFATGCVQRAHERPDPLIPDRFVLSLSMNPQVADLVDGKHGLNRTSPAIVAKSVTDWWYEAVPAINAAADASFNVLRTAGEDPAALQRVLDTWANTVEREWLT